MDRPERGDNDRLGSEAVLQHHNADPMVRASQGGVSRQRGRRRYSVAPGRNGPPADVHLRASPRFRFRIGDPRRTPAGMKASTLSDLSVIRTTSPRKTAANCSSVHLESIGFAGQRARCLPTIPTSVSSRDALNVSPCINSPSCIQSAALRLYTLARCALARCNTVCHLFHKRSFL